MNIGFIEGIANICSQCQEMYFSLNISHSGTIMLFSTAITWPLDSLTALT